MSFEQIAPEEFNASAFKVIGKDWLLVTGTVDGKSNAMTASWGGMGVMWNKNVVFLTLRPERYTKEFIDKAERFSISILGDDLQKVKNYFGSVSGRDEDKIKKAGLSVITDIDSDQVYFEDAKVAMVCKKLYVQEMKEECLLEEKFKQWYVDYGYHVLYIAEIEKLLINN